MFPGAVARPDRDAARDGRAHADDLVGRQDVQHDGLEDRLDVRAGAARRPRPAPPSSSSPTSTARRSSRRSPSGSTSATSSTPASPPTSTAKRDHLVAGLRAAGFTDVRPGGDVLHHRRHPPGRARRRRHGVLPLAAGAVRRRRHPQRGVLRPSRARSPPRALRLLQAPRRARRGGPATRGSLSSRTASRDPARHRVERLCRQLRPPAPTIAAAAVAGAGLVLLTETFSTGLAVDEPDARRAGGRPVVDVPRRKRRRARRCGSVAHVPGDPG